MNYIYALWLIAGLLVALFYITPEVVKCIKQHKNPENKDKSNGGA